MSSSPSSSISKRLTDLFVSRLQGDESARLPAWLGTPSISKNRSTAIGASELPLYSIYFVDETPSPVGGDQRRPIKISRKLTVEVRIVVQGNDDTMDPHRVWVVQRIVSADRCIADGTQLALGIVEAGTTFSPIEGTQGAVLETRVRFSIDYTTNPTDITKVS